MSVYETQKKIEKYSKIQEVWLSEKTPELWQKELAYFVRMGKDWTAIDYLHIFPKKFIPNQDKILKIITQETPKECSNWTNKQWKEYSTKKKESIMKLLEATKPPKRFRHKRRTREQINRDNYVLYD